MDNKPDDMPDVIYASPRGSGTMSGVYVDMAMEDEPETKYIRADRAPQPACNADLIKALEIGLGYIIYLTNETGQIKRFKETIDQMVKALSAAKRQPCNTKEGE